MCQIGHGCHGCRISTQVHAGLAPREPKDRSHDLGVVLSRSAGQIRAADALEADPAGFEDTLLDPYGAEDVVEFFAVASEAFFEAPASMADSHPRLYAGLRDFYGVDPAAWPEPAAAS